MELTVFFFAVTKLTKKIWYRRVLNAQPLHYQTFLSVIPYDIDVLLKIYYIFLHYLTQELNL